MKTCVNCGAQIQDQYQVCHNCGAQQPQAQAYQAPQQPTYGGPQQPAYGAPQPPMGYGQPFNMSNWDGSVLDTFVNALVASLMISFTCGIATPWAVCYMWNFIVNHATIDGRRLRFDGNGADLLGQWIVWLLLTVVTCGIYGFWVMPKMYKWVASHTHFAN